jgi:hypothetical protein
MRIERIMAVQQSHYMNTACHQSVLVLARRLCQYLRCTAQDGMDGDLDRIWKQAVVA